MAKEQFFLSSSLWRRGAGPAARRHGLRSRCSAPLVGVLVLAAVVVSGCGSDDAPRLATVHGKVTLDGKPLKKAGIGFTPIDGGHQSHAATDEEGHYELKYLRDVMGAKVGQHKVRISTANESEKKVELVPPRYNASSTLERAVQAGDNEIDFELSSK